MSLKDRLTSIFDVFSRRSPARSAGYPSDELSEQVRRRILILYRDVVAGQWSANQWSPSGNYTDDFWAQMHNSLEHLYGRVRLSSQAVNSLMDDAVAFVLHGTTEEFFDFLELSFRVECMWRILHERNDLVDAINEIFRVERAPYQLTRVVTREEPNSGPFRQGTTIHTVAWPRVIRSEDEMTYTEALAPALSVLSAPEFEAANLEFRDALDEYRKGHYGDCVTKCGSAFESVLKVLCTRKGWHYDAKKDTASTLLGIVLGKSSLDGFFSQPLMLIATMRNKLSSAHGGADRRPARCAVRAHEYRRGRRASRPRRRRLSPAGFLPCTRTYCVTDGVRGIVRRARCADGTLVARWKLSPRLSLRVGKTGPPEPTAANLFDRGSDSDARIYEEKRRWPKC